MKKPIIFLIEEDDDTRPLFRRHLKTCGYEVSLAVDEEDALERTSRGNLGIDLIMINLCRRTPEEMLDFAAGICRRIDLPIPVIAIAANFSADMEGKNVRKSENEYIVYLEEGEQLDSLLERLLPNRNGGNSDN